jgi:hypothetical protein
MITLTATPDKNNNGMWYFTCPLHGTPDEPFEHHFREPSSVALAIDTLKSHMDDKHPGVKVRIQINGKHIIHTTYTATTVVQTKGDLL